MCTVSGRRGPATLVYFSVFQSVLSQEEWDASLTRQRRDLVRVLLGECKRPLWVVTMADCTEYRFSPYVGASSGTMNFGKVLSSDRRLYLFTYLPLPIKREKQQESSGIGRRDTNQYWF